MMKRRAEIFEVKMVFGFRRRRTDAKVEWEENKEKEKREKC